MVDNRLDVLAGVVHYCPEGSYGIHRPNDHESSYRQRHVDGGTRDSQWRRDDGVPIFRQVANYRGWVREARWWGQWMSDIGYANQEGVLRMLQQADIDNAWRSHRQSEDARVYDYNTITRETTWDMPVAPLTEEPLVVLGEAPAATPIRSASSARASADVDVGRSPTNVQPACRSERTEAHGQGVGS